MTAASHVVEIYTQQGCAFCERAKALLRTRGIDFAEHHLTGDDDARGALVARSGAMTLPQIFAAGRHIGGFDELRELDQTGGLAQWATRTA